MKNEKRHIDIGILMIAICISAVGMILAILLLSKLYLNSDSAFYSILAQQQIEQRSLLPDGMCYSTSLFVTSVNLLYIPFMLIQENWILSRAMGSILLWAIIAIVIFKIFKEDSKFNYKIPIIIIALMLLPYNGNEILEFYFLQARNAPRVLFLALILCFLNRICEYSGKKKNVYIILISVVAALCNIDDVRSLLTLVLPLLLTLFFINMMERKKLCIFRREDEEFKIEIAIIVGAVCGVLIHIALSGKYWGFGGSAIMNLSSISDLSENIEAFFESLIEMFGGGANYSLFSLNGIIRCIDYLYFFIAAIVAPILSIRLLREVDNKFIRIVIVYANLSNLMLAVISIITGMTINRYLTSVYLFDIILLAIVLYYLNEKYKEQYEVKIITSVLILFLVVINQYLFWPQNIDALKSYNKDGLAKFLVENELYYGTASFWNSTNNMVYSNGQVIIFPYEDGKPSNPRNWLTQSRWFTEGSSYDKTFILLGDGESVDESYYDEAIEVLSYDSYTILVYHGNFLDKNYARTINSSLYNFTREVVISEDEAILQSDTIAFGPFESIEAGSYIVEFYGENMADEGINVDVYSNTNFDAIDYAIDLISNDMIVVNVNIKYQIPDVEYRLFNNSNHEVTFKKVTIKKNMTSE